jgi:hypothetical protein
VLDQAVDEIHRREGLAGAGGHLDQGARAVVRQRLFEAGDGALLDGSEVASGQRRDGAQGAAELGRALAGPEPFGKRPQNPAKTVSTRMKRSFRTALEPPVPMSETGIGGVALR